MSPIPHRRLRRDLGFRRPALVLSGGGAMGAYAVGVLQTLEAVGLRPAILAGVSVGAMTAVAWTANAFHTEPLVRVWSKLTPSSVGLRWNAMALRLLGLSVIVLAVIEAVLTLAGSSVGLMRLKVEHGAGSGAISLVLDELAWLAVGVWGWLLLKVSRDADEWIHRLGNPGNVRVWHQALGMALLIGLALHAATWITGTPYPHRFSATMLLVLAVVWVVNRSGPLAARSRALLMRLLPETGGRGVWRGRGRRRVLERLIAQGDRKRVIAGDPHLILVACALDSGRIAHFVNWSPAGRAFEAGVERFLGEVIPLHTADDMVAAAFASSAIPVVFEPVRIRGRAFVDAGGFTNQPIHAVIADGADAVLVVLVAPGHGPRPPAGDMQVLDVMGRVLELADWRDLHIELLQLPAEWLATGPPRRLCVVQPDAALPGGLFGFDPDHAGELMRRGAADAWLALERAGWLEPAPAPTPG